MSLFSQIPVCITAAFLGKAVFAKSMQKRLYMRTTLGPECAHSIHL